MRTLAIVLLSVWIFELLGIFFAIMKAISVFEKGALVMDEKARKVLFGPVLFSVVFGLIADILAIVALIRR